MTLTPIEHVQYGYDYVNHDMRDNDAYTTSMITDTLISIDMAYWRLARSERRKIVGR